MKVLKIVENKDGSATLDIEFREGEAQKLLEFGVITALENGIKVTERREKLKTQKKKRKKK